MRACPQCGGQMIARYMNGTLQGFSCKECGAFMLANEVDHDEHSGGLCGND